MSALRKKSSISLQGNVVGSKKKVVSLFYFHLISQKKIRHCRGMFVLKGYFHQGKSIFPGEIKSQ